MDLYDMVIKFIRTKHKKFFKNSDLVDEILAETYDITLSYIIHSKKRMHDPFFDEKKSLRSRVRGVVKSLEREGRVVKYSQLAWKKVNV
jgi:hypothetical protein